MADGVKAPPAGATARLACIACSSDVSQDTLPQCIVHSCCGRPVCAACLAARPRLATFCVRCEGVAHALRDRGPRADVTRAGQIVFDAERLMGGDEEDDDKVVEQDASGDEASDVSKRPPPPPYAATEGSGARGAFQIGDESVDSEVAATRQSPSTSTDVKTPSLMLQSSASPSAVVTGAVAHTTPRSAPSSEAKTVTDSLRTTLEQQGSRESRIEERAPHSRVRAPATSHSRSSSNGRSTIKSVGSQDDDANLTRQYWLRPNDSLMSLSLRFRVNAAELCKLNDLPPSTATSNPHLMHTRQFLLIPERAIQSALARAGSNGQGSSDVRGAIDDLESGLRGPAPMTRSQKLGRARREAQGRFRALVAQTETRVRATTSAVDVTPCDERAARAYIALMESELRYIDFGDAASDAGLLDADDTVKSKSDKVKVSTEEVEDDVLMDAARQRRYDAIVQQAVARWAMDSDWERRQRLEGRTLESRPLEGNRGATKLPQEKRQYQGTDRRSTPATQLMSWFATAGRQAEPSASRWRTVTSPASPPLSAASFALAAEK